MINEEELAKANKFLKELDVAGRIWTVFGKERYIIENVFHKILKLEKERDYYKARYLEFNNAFVEGGQKLNRSEQ